MIRAARFIRGYLGRTNVPQQEVRFGSTVATLYGAGRAKPAPGWVVLHGITVSAREHPALVRFARAVAASRAVVLVPEVPAWRDLEIAPHAAQDAIAASARYLATRDDVLPGGVGLIGFSFGATQALVAAAAPALQPSIRAVVGFGGYCDLRRTLRSMMTGEHEWNGVQHQLDPDPYGRWIVAANYLTRIPEYRDMDAVATALRELATEAGRLQVFAGDPELDRANAALRSRLTAQEQEVWDLLARRAGQNIIGAAEAERFADQLAAAGIATEPLLDPQPLLPGIRCRVVLAHGRADRLIPFTETLRLQSRLPARTRPSATITGLFAHSSGERGMRLGRYTREAARFAGLLNRALGVV